jgi:glycosyltransferase involved in cell wall biosynthesis
MVTTLNRIGVPSLVYFHDIYTIPAVDCNATAYAACSSAVAETAVSVLRRPAAVVPVLINAADYRVRPTGTAVTLINPIPRKGVEIAFSLASRRPDILFEFVEAWRLRGRTLHYLQARIAHYGNISFLPRTSDMKDVYQHSRLILAPSLWVEGWGRVVSEGQVSGIPALASDSGGLPQAVGPGGTIVARDASIAAWSAALDKLWDDDAFYKSKSAAALAHAERPEFQPQVIIDRLLTILNVLKSQ